jgi:hypothetical protein
LLHRAAHDAPQDVAAILVRRDDPIGEQDGHRATVVGEDPKRPGGREVLAVALAAQLLAELDERPEVVGLEHRFHVLEDRRHALEPHAGVDVLHRQLRQRAVPLELVLHEHEVPELEEPLGVVTGAVGVRPERVAPVEVELGARAAGAGRAGLPEVVLPPEQDDALAGDADRTPAFDRLLVRTETELLVAPEDADPDALLVEAEALGGQLEGELDGALLEVVADREVAEHLEEREMPVRHADVLDVRRAKGLLARGQAARRRLLLAAEVGLEGLHAGRGEQHRRVVRGRNERRGRHAQVPALLEEGQERPADLGRLHGSWSLGGWPAPPARPHGTRRYLQLASTLLRSLRT